MPRAASEPKRKRSPAAPPVDVLVSRRRPVQEAPELAGMIGELDQVVIPAAGWKGHESLPIRWAVVEAAALVPSHRPGSWTPDPRYPAGVQERDYGPATKERVKVEAQAAGFEPRLMLSDSPSPNDGPPLILPSGVVISGNSRAMTAQLVAGDERRRPALAAALLPYLAHSRVPGDFPRERVAAMKAPLLVRVLQVTAEQAADLAWLRDVGSRANMSLTQALDARRAASSAAARLSDDDVSRIAAAADPSSTPSEWLRGPGGKAAIAVLRGASVLTSRNEATYLDGSGALNDTGRAFVVRMLAAAVIADAALLDRLPQATLDQWAAAAAPILSAVPWGHDVREPARKMLRRWLSWRGYAARHGLNVSDANLHAWEIQGDLDLDNGAPPKIDGEVERLLWTVLLEHDGPRKFPAFWRTFAREAERHPLVQADWTMPSMSTAEVLALALEPPQADLFRLGNPATLRWDFARQAGSAGPWEAGPWDVPKRGATGLAMKIASDRGWSAIELAITDPIGEPIPVAIVDATTGKRRTPRPPLRYSNPLPAIDLGAVDQRGSYQRDVAAASSSSTLGPIFRWLLPGGSAPSDFNYRAAVKSLGSMVGKGNVYPWGVAAQVTDGPDGLIILDATGHGLRLHRRRAEWIEPTTRASNPPATAAAWFARRVGRAVPPVRESIEKLIDSAGKPVAVRDTTWANVRTVLEALHRTGHGLWAWGEFCSVPVLDTGGQALRDGYGYGLLWFTDEAGRKRVRWFGPDELIEEAPAASKRPTPAGPPVPGLARKAAAGMPRPVAAGVKG